MKNRYAILAGRAMMLVLSYAMVTTPTLCVACASNAPLTREQVRHQLEELEAAGYDPALTGDVNYPEDLLEAERKVAAKHAADKQNGKCPCGPPR